MIEHVQRAVVSVDLRNFHTVVTSTQQAERLEAVCSKEVAGTSGSDQSSPGMAEIICFIKEKVPRKTLGEINFKSGHPALRLYGEHVHRKTLALLDGRFSSIRTAVGRHMMVGHSTARNSPKWTGLLLTSAVVWPIYTEQRIEQTLSNSQAVHHW